MSKEIRNQIFNLPEGGSSGSSWTPQKLGSKILFWGKISEIAGGQMPNKVTGSSDFLTVTGSPATYQCPNTAPYIDADTDYIWFDIGTELQRTVTTAELIGYDLQRTPVKYLDDAPNTLEEIVILKAGEVLTAGERDYLFRYMKLSILWDNSINFYGHIKSNRITQNLWNPAFVTTWQTENTGSATKTIIVPTTGVGYDCYINWGDGSALEHQVGTPGNITHVYATTGIKTVSISGVFPQIYFNSVGDKLKLKTIAHWGTGGWIQMANAFAGCANLIGTYTDIPDTSAVTNFSYMFHNCSLFNSAVNFNTSAGTSMYGMFDHCTAFNQPVSTFDTSNVTIMVNMFYYCASFNQSVSNFNTVAVTNMNSMFAQCASFNQSVSNFNTAYVTDIGAMFQFCLSFKQSLASFNISSATVLVNLVQSGNINSPNTATNYDATLIAWNAQVPKLNINVNFGTSKYTAGGAAAAARAALIADHNWTITDGGTL